MTENQLSKPKARTVMVWDPLVRIFHWSLVASFIGAYLTGDEWDFAHEIIGYVIVTLLVIRMLWGFLGSRHARFRDFLYKPATVLAFLRDSLRFKAKRYLGHNPAGGVMVVVLLLTLTGICVSGVALTIGQYREVKWIEEIHEFLVNGSLVLIGLHIAGVIVASVEHRENLIMSMVTGYKRFR